MKPVGAEFRFVNSGTTTVRFLSIRPSCDCSTASADKAGYAPGESGVIRAEFAPAASEGRIERTIAVTTDDNPDTPTILKIVLETQEAIAVASRNISWGLGDAPVEKSIEIVIAEPGKAAIGGVQVADSTFDARIEATDPARGRYHLNVKPAKTDTLAQAALRLKAVVDGQQRVIVIVAGVR
jgi:hypothetical protein